MQGMEIPYPALLNKVSKDSIRAHYFFAKLDVNQTTGCWEWNAYRTPKGYGKFQWDKKRGIELAHRISYRLANNSFNENLCVLHRCDNSGCCNPEHLFLGTKADNNADMRAKGRARMPRTDGPNNPQTNLTWEKVREIRRLRKTGLTLKAIGAQFNLCESAVSHIVLRRNWANDPLEALEELERNSKL